MLNLLRRGPWGAPVAVTTKPAGPRLVYGSTQASSDLSPWTTSFDSPAVQWLRVVPYATASDWFLTSLGAVARLSNLPTNWDSYGSPPVTSEARAQALRLLMLIEGEASAIPQIGPVSGGGLQLEWSNGLRALELEVRPDGAVEFLRVYEDDRMEEGTIPTDRVDRLRQQMSWLFAE